ncbi:hypothetical protein [Streptomyces spongiae]|uniref:Uncharacterized protein n=1 Tax=Streptomyces spongiae TaxID=565072 RepID=A0A5N8XXD4_9ACTN|nr:hypothetical protein [Streptomyces spongiae]MPY63375.1 hypothetical protein [Streptomyces spongiae]
MPEPESAPAADWHNASKTQGSSLGTGDAQCGVTDQLVTALRAKPVPPCLVMDAVDEAEHPADLVSAVLLDDPR